MKELTPVNVAIALKPLTQAKTKSLMFFLGVPLNELDDIERLTLYGGVKIRFIQQWLDCDLRASWDKIVSGLRHIDMVVLANKIARETQVQTASTLEVNISVLIRYLEQIRTERQLRALAMALSSGSDSGTARDQAVSPADQQTSAQTTGSQTSTEATESADSQTVQDSTPDQPGTATTSREAELMSRMQKMEDNMRKMTDVVQALHYTVNRCETAMRVMRVEVQALCMHAHNGSFTWRIPEISRRIQDAVNDRIKSIYSPPFYSAHKGYRMCIRAYLNGDGVGKGTHLSVFCVIMRSEHDSELQWPFQQQVSLILINQKDPRESIVQTFKPDPASSSFQRPRQNMNIASGCPTFAPLSVLHDQRYVAGDEIKVQVITSKEQSDTEDDDDLYN